MAGWRRQDSACAGACGTHRKLLRADTKNLHHCTDGGPGSHSPSVEWDGHITSKHRLVSLVSKFEVHSGGGGGFSSKVSARVVTRLPDTRVHRWERLRFSPHNKQSLGLGLPWCFPLS